MLLSDNASQTITGETSGTGKCVRREPPTTICGDGPQGGGEIVTLARLLHSTQPNEGSIYMNVKII